MSEDKKQKEEEVSPDEALLCRMRGTYDAVKKAIEANKQPTQELQEASKIFAEVLAESDLLNDKPKAAKFFYGDFVNGACRRLLLEGPIDDGEVETRHYTLVHGGHPKSIHPHH